MEKLSHGSNDRVWWKMTRSLSGLSKPSCRAAPNVDALGGFFASKFFLSDDFAVLSYPHYHVSLLLFHLKIHGGYDYPGFALC